MNSFLIYLLVFLAIVIPLMIFHRRYKLKKQEAEMREIALLQENVTEGVRNMRGNDYEVRPRVDTTKRQQKKSKANLHVVDKTETKPTDDAWMFGASAMSGGSATPAPTPVQPSTYDDNDPRKFAGGGGTFDGGGSSGDWDRPSSSSRDSDYSSSSRDSDSSSNSSYSSSSDSSSSDSSSSSSSDSGSSSSSSD